MFHGREKTLLNTAAIRSFSLFDFGHCTLNICYNHAMKAEINISDLEKIDIRTGTILECEEIEGSDKLYKLTVDFGLELGTRIILTGMKKYYQPSDMKGMQTTFVVNLAPRKMMGLESQGMIFAASSKDGTPVFLQPKKQIEDGAELI